MHMHRNVLFGEAYTGISSAGGRQTRRPVSDLESSHQGRQLSRQGGHAFGSMIDLPTVVGDAFGGGSDLADLLSHLAGNR